MPGRRGVPRRLNSCIRRIAIGVITTVVYSDQFQVRAISPGADAIPFVDTSNRIERLNNKFVTFAIR